VGRGGDRIPLGEVTARASDILERVRILSNPYIEALGGAM